jgi:lipopolysaccharide/colanic/teichoic acid biosynthesis glycosyltransferase
MISEKLRFSILMADAAWIVTTLLIVGHFWPAGAQIHYLLLSPNVAVSYLLGASLIVWSILYSWLKLDGFQRGWSWASMTSWLLIGVLILAIALCGAINQMHRRSAFAAIGSIVFLFYAGFVFIRMLARHLLRGPRWSGRRRRMIILGDGRVARELASKIDEHPEMRTQVVGFFSTGGQSRHGRDDRPPRGVSTLEIVEVFKEKSITDLVIVLSQSASREVASLVALCRNAGITVSLVPEYYDLYVSLPRLFDIGGVPLLQVEQPSARKRLLAWKPVMDFALTVVLGILSLPLLAVAALHVYLRQGRVLDRETRCGRNGEHFSLYRLAVKHGDSGNSWFMNLLNHTSLTELPQFWNVLRGDMSLVGPRPETPERIKHYSDWHRRRLSIKPGITGWAQVHGLRNRDSSDEKARFDLHYILKWSPLLDCVVLLQTGWTLLTRVKVSLEKRHFRTDLSAESREESRSLPEHHADCAQSSAS